MWTDVLLILDATLRISVPFVLAAMGGIFAERSGVIDFGLEGKMLGGAFVAATVAHLTQSAWWGLLGSIGIGIIFSMILNCLSFFLLVFASVCSFLFFMVFFDLESVLLNHLSENNRFDISEPCTSTRVDLNELDIIFLPCVCFDSKGNRIGMGGGFYDKTLDQLSNNQKPQLILLAYNFQEVESCFVYEMKELGYL